LILCTNNRSHKSTIPTTHSTINTTTTTTND
jgi:hypothetical protein